MKLIRWFIVYSLLSTLIGGCSHHPALPLQPDLSTKQPTTSPPTDNPPDTGCGGVFEPPCQYQNPPIYICDNSGCRWIYNN